MNQKAKISSYVFITMLLFLVCHSSCKKKIRGCMDSTSINYNAKATEDDGSCTYALTIGRSYQGGVIAYVLLSSDPGYDANVTHGLIAAALDQSTGIGWWNGNYISTFASGTAVGTGNTNTNSIVNYQKTGSFAAKICFDLVLGGFSDWYLPSRDELNHLYENKTTIGGFATTGYWSSSENSNSGAWGQTFDVGGQVNYTKNLSLCVRAVRSF